jgi:outer membrane lipoprotein-sorting protein
MSYILRSLLTLLTLSAFATSALAQQDERAKKVLVELSEHYKEIPSFKATITQEMVNLLDDTRQSISANIAVMGDMYRVDLGDQEIINNHETVWTHLKDLQEVNVDNYDPDAEDGMLSPQKLLGMYKDGFKYLHLGTQKFKEKSYTVIDLSPDRNAKEKLNFFKVTLYIDAATKELKHWEVYENGNRRKYTYSISDFDGNVKLTAKDFSFNTADYPDVEVIDLR